MNAKGSCACAAVTFEVNGPLRPIISCHCIQCRKTSGHFVAATATRRRHFQLISDTTLRWYSAQEGYRRGFCDTCGSSLFFESRDEDRVSIAAGCLDPGHANLVLTATIFAAEKGEYYTICAEADSISQNGDHRVEMPD